MSRSANVAIGKCRDRRGASRQMSHNREFAGWNIFFIIVTFAGLNISFLDICLSDLQLCCKIYTISTPHWPQN